MGAGVSVKGRLPTVLWTSVALLALSACGHASQQSRPGVGPDSVPDAQAVAPLTDQLWDTPMGLGWSYLRRAGSKDDDVVTDDSAPFGNQEILKIIFTPDMKPDSEPGVHWRTLRNVNEVYAEWWMKLSPNWNSSPAGGGKIAFIWAPGGEGQMYAGLYGSQAPHHISINTQWAPYGTRVWDPNVARTPIYYDRWYRMAWYAKWPTKPGAQNGVVRWWVDGVLGGSYTNVAYPAPVTGFQQFEFAPTLQMPPPAEQYMYIGPTRISTW